LRLGTSFNLAEVIHVGGTEPTAQLLSTVGVDAGWRASGTTIVFAEGAIGGSSFDFDGLGFAGRIHNQTWRAATGIRQELGRSPSLELHLSVGGAYTEVSSWAQNDAGRHTGPLNRVAGAFVGFGGSAGFCKNLRVFGELTQSAGYGSANDPALHAHYEWFYRGIQTAIGLEWNREIAKAASK